MSFLTTYNFKMRWFFSHHSLKNIFHIHSEYYNDEKYFDRFTGDHPYVYIKYYTYGVLLEFFRSHLFL